MICKSQLLCVWGIGPETQAEYRSYWQNTLGPFRDWYRMLSLGKSPQAGARRAETPPG